MHIAQPTIAAAPDATVSAGSMNFVYAVMMAPSNLASLNVCDFDHSAAE